MTISLASLLLSETRAAIYNYALGIATGIGLPVTSWQVGDPDLVTTGRLVAPTIEMHALKQIAMRAHPRDTAPGRVCTGCPAIDDEPCADDCATMDPRSGVFQRIYRELVVESTPRNELIVSLIAQAPKPALAFVKNLDHAKYLLAMLTRAVGSVRLVNGSKSTRQREQVVRELRRGELDVAVATSVWEAGVDIPELRTVANAGAGASSIRTVQMLGRGLRGAEGKDAALMLDILDLGEPSLERHARQRRKAYRDAGFEVVER
jgi:superfamily II DNA or RNA helicase